MAVKTYKNLVKNPRNTSGITMTVYGTGILTVLYGGVGTPTAGGPLNIASHAQYTAPSPSLGASMTGILQTNSPAGYYTVGYYLKVSAAGIAYIQGINETLIREEYATVIPANQWVFVSAAIYWPGPVEGGSTSTNMYSFYRANVNTAYTISVTGLMLVENQDPQVPYTGGYFDGSVAGVGAASYAWDGAANNSVSTQTVQVVEPATPLGVATLTVIGRG